jgi:hypothetical protein
MLGALKYFGETTPISLTTPIIDTVAQSPPTLRFSPDTSTYLQLFLLVPEQIGTRACFHARNARTIIVEFQCKGGLIEPLEPPWVRA